MKNKKGLELVTSHFRLQNKSRRIPLLVVNYLTKLFLSYSQNYIC